MNESAFLEHALYLGRRAWKVSTEPFCLVGPMRCALCNPGRHTGGVQQELWAEAGAQHGLPQPHSQAHAELHLLPPGSSDVVQLVQSPKCWGPGVWTPM